MPSLTLRSMRDAVASSTQVRQIEEFGYSWTLDPDFDLTQLTPGKRVQIRSHYGKAVDEMAPSDWVEKYKIKMDAGSEFPPPVVTLDNWLLDGNTRVGAYRARRDFSAPVIIINQRWETASEQERHEMFIIAAAGAADTGNPLTREENAELIRHFVARGTRPGVAARILGVHTSVVSAARRQQAAEARMARAGLDSRDFTPTAVRSVMTRKVLDLNDQPFAALVRLASDAGLGSGEVSLLVDKVKETGSDAGALQVLEDERLAVEDRIRERVITGTLKTAMSPSTMVRRQLGYLTKFAGDEVSLAKIAPSLRDTYIRDLKKAVGVLSRTIEILGR